MTDLSYRNVKRVALYKLHDTIGRKLSNHIRFIHTSELLNWAGKMAWSIQSPYDTIVYVPDSGYLPGRVMADIFQYPLLSSDSSFEAHSPKNILIVDDTANTGETMKLAKAKVQTAFPNAKVETAAVIVSKGHEFVVDHYHTAIQRDRMCEWNMHKADLGHVVTDMDGVLCENPKENYLEWIYSDPKERFIPERKLDTIVTARREEYRLVTQRWLAQHGVRYESLKMGLTDMNDRIELIKGMRPKPDLILESDISHAKRLWNSTGIPTLCFDTKEMFS